MNQIENSSSAEVKLSEIPDRADRLLKSISGLENTVELLLTRLQPYVLRNEPPEKEVGDKPANPTTGLGETLWGAERRVQCLTSSINNAIGRLEL